jgi:hypothetical protein
VKIKIKRGPADAMPQSGLRHDSENRSKAYSHILATIDCLEASQIAIGTRYATLSER